MVNRHAGETRADRTRLSRSVISIGSCLAPNALVAEPHKSGVPAYSSSLEMIMRFLLLKGSLPSGE